MRNELRDVVVTELQSRMLAACVRQAGAKGGMPLDVLINDTLYHERKRLETDTKNPRYESDLAFWQDVKSRLGRSGEMEQRKLLESIIGRFATEVLGNFNPWVYRYATGVIPRAMPVLLNAMSPKRLLDGGGLPRAEDSIRVKGDVEGLERAHQHGTVILCPTHVSNLDSPVVGWALYALGLPPFTYGAGLNLFTNPIMSFFMRNLGAYRVDRRKTAPLYRDILKEYATIAIENGQDNLFFPGGTRARSGAVERKLKLGLLSSGLRAYINNLINRKSKPNVYVVPCTLNYHLVLEAQTLIEDHLKAVGKSRFIIEDDEFSKPRQVLAFLRSAVSLDSRISITIGEALDVFGNRIDEHGASLDQRGRPIDIERYVHLDGLPAHVPQRDRVYTQQCGAAIRKSFWRNNEVLSTNLVAFTAFQMIRSAHPEMEFYRFLRTAGDGAGLEMGALTEGVRRVAEAINEFAAAGRIQVDESVAHGDPRELVAGALRHFLSYHARPVLARRGDRVFVEDMTLLLYYHNRLDGYGLERVVNRGSSREVA